MSVGRRVLAVGTAILTGSLGGLAAAGVVSDWFSATKPLGLMDVIALAVGFSLGLTLWFVLVRRLDLFSWDELYEYFGIEEHEVDDESGFTLIEVLVVIVVIALLATLVAPNVFRHPGTAKDATARSQIQMLGAAPDTYRLDNSRYPTTEQGLKARSRAPSLEPRPRNWRGRYLRGAVPGDPWAIRTSTVGQARTASRVQSPEEEMRMTRA